jgi:hypothetical protein
MATTVTLDKKHFKALAVQARGLGKTPQGYIHSLIDAANLTFDEVLAPVRASFAKSGISEDELDEAVTAARKAIHGKARRKLHK